MKTKTVKPQKLIIANQQLVLHKGVLYHTELESFETALEKGVDDDGYEITDYPSATVDDVKKVVGIVSGLAKAVAQLNKAKGDLEDMMLFNENVSIDEDGDITVGCTYVTPEQAANLIKQLGRK